MPLKPASFIFVLLFLISCSSEKDRRLLSPDNLESWKFTVDENTDSVFKTPKGALLKIEKGTFSKKVELEVKEAYTMRDILLGGLTTTSNGEPLSSGGMIYFNSADKNQLDILKPISVAVPTTFVDTDMQIFKGEVSGDSINWVKPDTLPESNITNNLEVGKQLFQQNCNSCHRLDLNGTGPALRGFRQRGPWSSNIELRKWVRNPARYMASNNYTRNLQRQWGTIMQAFPALSNSQIDAIAFYIDNETNSPYIDSLLGAEGLCTDTVYMRNADSSVPVTDLDPDIFEDTFNLDTATFNVNIPEAAPLRGGAYVFDVISTGWYNIDILVEKLPGSLPCDVQIKVSPFAPELSVNLLIPKYRIMLPGNDNGEVFTFEKGGNKPEFVYGTDAVVIAFAEGDEEFYYGAIKFAMSQKASLTVSLRKGNRSDFEKLLKQQKLDGDKQSAIDKADAALKKAFEAIEYDNRTDTMRLVTRPCGGAAADSTSWRRNQR